MPTLTAGVRADLNPHPTGTLHMLNQGLVIDYETRSRCDLKKQGAYKYTTHPSTDILCLGAYDLTTDEQWLIYPWFDDMPKSLRDAFQRNPLIIAHNAGFDAGIHEFLGPCYSFPAVEPERWYCSSAQARVNALPASLDNATRALNSKHRKDHRGTALIRALSIPDAKTGYFNEDPKLIAEMGAYCMKDVLATVELVRNTRPMTQQEHRDWVINEYINNHGVRIDTELASLACTYADVEKDELSQEMQTLTQGAITKTTQSARVKKWLLDEFEHNPRALAAMTKYVNGVKKHTADAGAREHLLYLASTGEITISDLAHDVIQIMQEGSMSSVAKFSRMLDMADPDDNRVRGAFVFAGASQTHRFASRGLQLHNFKRACYCADKTVALKSQMKANEDLPDVMKTLSKLLRPALVPAPEHVFVVGDWSAIEARVLPWLTDDPRAVQVLDVFRAGIDIYVHTADSMHMTSGTSDAEKSLYRMIGKVATLALGFGGGVGAFSAMAKIYGLTLTHEQMQEIVDKWRAANPWATKFWRDLEKGAKTAIKRPHRAFKVGRVAYMYVPSLIGGTLMCTLPDGTTIQYPQARIEPTTTPWGAKTQQITYLKASLTASADATEWPRASLWGGLMAENITQATAACLLRAVRRGIYRYMIADVHDEIILEVSVDAADTAKSRLKSVMHTPPDWARTLPLHAEPVIMMRYGKAA